MAETHFLLRFFFFFFFHSHKHTTLFSSPNLLLLLMTCVLLSLTSLLRYCTVDPPLGSSVNRRHQLTWRPRTECADPAIYEEIRQLTYTKKNDDGDQSLTTSSCRWKGPSSIASASSSFFTWKKKKKNIKRPAADSTRSWDRLIDSKCWTRFLQPIQLTSCCRRNLPTCSHGRLCASPPSSVHGFCVYKSADDFGH